MYKLIKIDDQSTHIDYKEVSRYKNKEEDNMKKINNLVLMEKPFSWSEDFGHFSQSESGGCYFGLGSGCDHPSLHSKYYDFNDELIPMGIDLWTRIAMKALQAKSW